MKPLLTTLNRVLNQPCPLECPCRDPHAAIALRAAYLLDGWTTARPLLDEILGSPSCRVDCPGCQGTGTFELTERQIASLVDAAGPFPHRQVSTFLETQARYADVERQVRGFTGQVCLGDKRLRWGSPLDPARGDLTLRHLQRGLFIGALESQP
jgi:hypothetical protein